MNEEAALSVIGRKMEFDQQFGRGNHEKWWGDRDLAMSNDMEAWTLMLQETLSKGGPGHWVMQPGRVCFAVQPIQS